MSSDPVRRWGRAQAPLPLGVPEYTRPRVEARSGVYDYGPTTSNASGKTAPPLLPGVWKVRSGCSGLRESERTMRGALLDPQMEPERAPPSGPSGLQHPRGAGPLSENPTWQTSSPMVERGLGNQRRGRPPHRGRPPRRGLSSSSEQLAVSSSEQQ